MKRIDVHHHIFPSTLPKSDINTRIGWKTPEGNLPWSPYVSLKAMDEMHISKAILSYPAGFPSGPPGPENRRTVRELNIMASKICEEHPDRFGFFACLPDLSDSEGEGFLVPKNASSSNCVTGAIAEIAFALDNLNAAGFSLSSSYGEGEHAGRLISRLSQLATI